MFNCSFWQDRSEQCAEEFYAKKRIHFAENYTKILYLSAGRKWTEISAEKWKEKNVSRLFGCYTAKG